MKTAADLHSSQFAVKSHCPWGVGGDFAGILLSALAATVYKANTKVSTIDSKNKRDRESEVKWQLQTAEVDVSAQSWKTELEGKEDSKETGRRGKSMQNRNKGKTPLQQKGFWQPVPLQMDR